MKTIIIDVRSEKEYLEGSYPGSLNIPLPELESSNFEQFDNAHIALLCNSGNRAEKAKVVLKTNGIDNVSLLQNQMQHIIERTDGSSTIWTIDRQFRFALGLIIGVSILANFLFLSILSLSLILIVFAGLIFSSITDNCYLKELITIMPWNRKPRKVDNEFHSTSFTESRI